MSSGVRALERRLAAANRRNSPGCGALFVAGGDARGAAENGDNVASASGGRNSVRCNGVVS